MVPASCKTVGKLEHVQVMKTDVLFSRITCTFLYDEIVIKKIKSQEYTSTFICLMGYLYHCPSVWIQVLELICPDWRSSGNGS